MSPNVGLGTQGPVERGWGLWLTSVLGVAIAGVFVGARLAQRFMKRSGLGLDDWMIIAALISSILLTVTECQAVVYGYGRHWNTLPASSRVTARKWFYGANIIYKVVLMFTKLSVVCLYYRIFAVTTNAFRIACHVMNICIICTGLAFSVATVFQCSPMAAFWDQSMPSSKCFKNEPWWISHATVQISTDFLLLALPFRRILELSMGRAEKLGIALVFGTGGFVTFASIYRATTIASSANDKDPTWGPIPATVWSVIEANAGIICACLPMLRGPFVRLFGPRFGPALGKGGTKRRSHHISWRSNHPHGAAGTGNGSDASHTESGSERDSEDVLPPSRPGAIGRSGSGIQVTNKLSVESTDGYVLRKQERETRPDSNDGDTNTAASVNEDKPGGKSPFYHV